MQNDTTYTAALITITAGLSLVYAGSSEAQARKAARSALRQAGSTADRATVRYHTADLSDQAAVESAHRRGTTCALFGWRNPRRAGVGRTVELCI